MVKQLARQGIALARNIDHGTETARIMQAQQATRCLQVEVIMRPTLAQRRLVAAREAQTARHAQVHEQQAFAQVQQQILAASAHPSTTLPTSACGCRPRGQRRAFPRWRLQSARPQYGLQRAARDLDFG